MRKAFILFRHAPSTGEAQKPITLQETKEGKEVVEKSETL